MGKGYHPPQSTRRFGRRRSSPSRVTDGAPAESENDSGAFCTRKSAFGEQNLYLIDTARLVCGSQGLYATIYGVRQSVCLISIGGHCNEL